MFWGETRVVAEGVVVQNTLGWCLITGREVGCYKHQIFGVAERYN